MVLRISIGVLAHNEAQLIGQMLQSVLQQSLLQQPDLDAMIELIVVPNGCTDETAAIARSVLESSIQLNTAPSIQWKICGLKQPGKANAWNQFVHVLSDPAAKYLILMDSDIQLLDPQTLRSLIQTLEQRPEVWVTVDRCIKDVILKEKKTITEKLSVLVSGLSGTQYVEESAAWISGQLYCARANVLRNIWLPTTLPVDDSFVYTMLVTNGLRNREEPDRVILAKSASHAFEAYTQPGRLLRHEKWLILGQTVNQILYADLRQNLEQQPQFGELIRQRNEQDPNWLNSLIQKEVHQKGWWIIPHFILIRRFQSLRYKPLHKAILFLPLATIAFLVDLLLSIQVNIELKRLQDADQWKPSGVWGKSTS